MWYAEKRIGCLITHEKLFHWFLVVYFRFPCAFQTFGDLNSEISSSGQSAEISLAFTPTTLALLESTFVEFGESLAMPRQTESGSVGAWEHSTSGMSEYSDDSEDTSFSTEWTAGGKQIKLCDGSASVTEMVNDGRPTRRLPGPRPSCKDEEVSIGHVILISFNINYHSTEFK